MARLLYQNFHRNFGRMYWLALAFFFLLGLLSGGYLFLRADVSFTSMMCQALGCRVSIVGLAGVLFLPFLFSAFAVHMRQFWLLWIIAFWKALSFSYTGLGILAAFGSGGWLALPLLMFSDICVLPVLWFYWLRRLDGRSGHFGCMLYLLLIGSLDYFIVSPFVACL